MPVTKNEIKPKRMMRKWTLVYEPLKIPGLLLLMVSTFLLGSFASAAPRRYGSQLARSLRTFRQN